MPTPLVSVVMPAKNAAAFLAEAVASVRAQTLSEWELLVIDDGSSDETAVIPLRFCDARIRVLKNSSAPGVAGAANTGTRAATGRYIARMDADDLMLPQRLERQLQHLDQHPHVVLCGSWLELFGAEFGIWRYPELDGDIKALLLFQCCIGHPSVMLRRHVVLQDELLYDTAMQVNEDYDLWMRLSARGEFYCIQDVLTRYRRHPRQLTEQNRSVSRGILAALRSRWLRSLFGEIDSTTMAVHESLASLAYRYDPGFVDAAGAWCERLLMLNCESRVFDQPALRRVLRDKLYDVCATIAPVGLAVYTRMRASELGRRLGWDRRGRVLAKAMLGSLTSRLRRAEQ